MANARKTAARKARRAVNRGDRVKATPETLAKLRPHPLELLLARGREGGGLDADQLQCCEEIADAAQAIAPASGYASADLEAVGHSAHVSLMSPRGEWLSTIWFAWAVDLARLARVRPWAIVELIGSSEPLDPPHVAQLGGALDLWARVRRDLDRASRRGNINDERSEQ
jgi:hypothetical protein